MTDASMEEAEPAWDVFISHASEDKETLVRPLAELLTKLGVKVWYDEFTLRVGDSLTRSIDKGLSGSRYGIVVLSPDFFSKNWPEYEYRGLNAKEMAGGKVILPIWYRVKRAEVLKYSPPLADKYALPADGQRLESLALKLLEVIRPDILTGLQRRLAYLETLRTAERGEIELARMVPGPIQHERLSQTLVNRIRLIRAALCDIRPHSMTYWIDGFRRDTYPEDEVSWWEHVTACFLEYRAGRELTGDQARRAFATLVGLGGQFSDDQLLQRMGTLPQSEFEVLKKLHASDLPLTDIAEDPFPGCG